MRFKALVALTGRKEFSSGNQGWAGLVVTDLLGRCGPDNSQRLEGAEKSRNTAECKTHSWVRKAKVLGEALSK